MQYVHQILQSMQAFTYFNLVKANANYILLLTPGKSCQKREKKA